MSEKYNRFVVADPLKDAKNASFFPLFKRLSINLSLEDLKYQILPYD